MGLVSFLKEVRAELSKVVWPTKQHTIQATILVVVISIFVGVYVGGLDLIFTSLMNTILK
ncbi:MAG: preprotein translocase subunit SecE [Candidatus Blackburnbacteria bacterium]|nr:preprotein translocase subunit SecE [Candidatus Blackburnbacteria bacterium]